LLRVRLGKKPIRSVSIQTGDSKPETYGDSYYDITMPFQNLDNLTRLQIPEVDLVIFTTGDDPLATGNAEASSDTEFGVQVSSIGLETA
jgi:hypothetical protein